MNCEKCVSQKVCKMWEQVEILTERLIRPPYALSYGAGGPVVEHKRQVAREQDIQNLLGEAVAKSCRLYVNKSVLQKK